MERETQHEVGTGRCRICHTVLKCPACGEHTLHVITATNERACENGCTLTTPPERRNA